MDCKVPGQSKISKASAGSGIYISGNHLALENITLYYLQQIPYAIGRADPLPIYVHSYGTSERSDSELCEIVKKNFSLRPGEIIE